MWPAGTEPERLRVLGVFAHPDDETFSAGGLLALAAAGGAEVTVACATRGEAGVLLGAAALAGQSVGDVRAAELAAACQALGAQPPRFLGLPDGGLAGVDDFAGAGGSAGVGAGSEVGPGPVSGRSRGQACVAAMLADVRPHLVVTLGPDGAYGHADHLACTAWVRAAVAALVPAVRPRLLLAVFPQGMFAPVWQRMRKAPGVVLASEIEAAGLGVPAAAADLRLDIRAVAGRKRAALAAHRSQLPGGDPTRFLAPALPRAALDRLMAEEWFVHADGPALAAGAQQDVFAALAGLTP
jgi:N-acetyl-1-D-myo-inositol-2-amino-2-deoxy-alpha-D-glucopyranoside deacetylase